MFERITRNFAQLSFWVAVTICCLILNAIVALANYLGVKTSLEVLGYEMMPLWMDKLLGPLLAPFFGEATIAHLYSIGLTATIEFGIFVVLYLLFDIFGLYQSRRACLEDADWKSARAALELIVRDAIVLALFAVPVFFACRWDIVLFRFRSIAATMGIEDPGAASSIRNWEIQLQENGHLFAWIAAKVGAWGYIAVTVIASLGIEFSFLKLTECWVRLCDCFEKLAGPDPDDPGPDDPDPKDPMQAEAELTLEDIVNTMGRRKHEVNPHESLEREPSIPKSRIRQGGPEDSRADPGSIRKTDAPATNTPSDDTELREVIGGEGESISLADARANPDKYWIDPEKGEVWDAEYRKELRGEEEQ